MWISRERLEALEYKVRELEASVKGPASLTQRVSDLEAQTGPLRAGDKPPFNLLYLYGDTRPRVSMRDALNLVIAHLKLKLTKTDAVPERFALEKAK